MQITGTPGGGGRPHSSRPGIGIAGRPASLIQRRLFAALAAREAVGRAGVLGCCW